MPKSPKNEEISVAEATRRVVDGKPSILDCLRHEVINFSALAQMIMPEVLSVCKKEKAKIDSIKMSLMRYTDELNRENEILEQRVSDIISKSELQLKNDLVVITVNSNAIISKINTLMEFIDKFRFFQLIQGTRVFTILADYKHKSEVLSIFSPTSIKNIIEDQTALILTSPKEITNVQGVVAYITYIIASGQINITQIMSCDTDTIFLVDEKDSSKAWELLWEKIRFLRKFGLKK